MIYITADGESVDYIAWKYYGESSNANVSAILSANAGLADYGPILPSGLSVTLPSAAAVTAQTASSGVKLWD